MALQNTAVRIIVSLLAIPLILLTAYLGGIYFLLFVLGIALISFHELSGMAKHKNINPQLWFGMISVFLIILNYYNPVMRADLLIIAVVTLSLIYELFRNKGSAIYNVGFTVLGIMYIGLFSASILRIRELYSFPEEAYLNGGLLIIALFIGIWTCDSAAFFIGTAIGKHKLFPRVSPNKSWEGAIAGFVFSAAVMVAMKFIFLGFLSTIDVLIIGIIIGTVGQIGDLVESLIKRDAGVKDSSALIPGHGGIYDRFDSLLLIAPVVYIYLYFIN
mgnify:CR=1 FL=1